MAMMKQCTIFQSIFDKQPFHISVDEALDRIQNGKSAAKVAEIRNSLDKVKADSLKKSLPAVTFAGKLAARGDKHLIEHSGFIVLDFDKLTEIDVMMAKMAEFPSTYAAWLSPSGSGIKALIRIADGLKHRLHFDALRERFPDADPSGANEERLCFESHDPYLYRNTNAEPFTKVLTIKTITQQIDATNGDEGEKFKRLLKWLSNKNHAFSDGGRNKFIYRLSCACCKYGIEMTSAGSLMNAEFPTTNDFTQREMLSAVKSAYRRFAVDFGSLQFLKDELVESKSQKEIKLADLPDFDPDAPARDVVYAAEVKAQALAIYDNGYGFVQGIDCYDIDLLWKPKRGELTCLTGIGNYGKSAFYKWYQLMRCLKYGERFASFSPEDNPPEEYYHDFVEILLACDCTPANPNRPTKEEYEKAYDWVGKHIFYVYPKEHKPTPEFIKERLLELIVKEKIDGCCIDPFNQLSNDYGGRSDKYLEALFLDLARFAQINNVYFMIVAHPKLMGKGSDGNYECPDVFDLADGAMWNNKMDNILTYHRPFAQTDPNNPECELHSKKIRRQKTVGKKGFTQFRYVRTTRRFEIDNCDPVAKAMDLKGIRFGKGYNPSPLPHAIFNPKIDIPDDFWDD